MKLDITPARTDYAVLLINLDPPQGPLARVRGASLWAGADTIKRSLRGMDIQIKKFIGMIVSGESHDKTDGGHEQAVPAGERI
jgi:hypothetical protein